MSAKYYKTVDIFLKFLPTYIYNSTDTESADLLTSLLNSIMVKVINNFDKIVVSEY
jgi:hypothetical protein